MTTRTLAIMCLAITVIAQAVLLRQADERTRVVIAAAEKALQIGNDWKGATIRLTSLCGEKAWDTTATRLVGPDELGSIDAPPPPSQEPKP